MLTDGLKLLGASTASNFTIDNGPTLPVDDNNLGELFFQTGVGLHVYTENGWIAVGTPDAEQIATALGYTPAALDVGGKLTIGQLPPLTITNTFVAANQAEMLAVTAETGDVVVRTDLNQSFILKGTDPATLADWQELLTPVAGVSSVNTQTGAVTLTTSNIAEGTNLYYTNARARTAISVTGGGATYNNTTGVLTISTPVTGAVGSAGAIQISNGSGGFSSDAGLTYASSTLTTNGIIVNGSTRFDAGVEVIGGGVTIGGQPGSYRTLYFRSSGSSAGSRWNMFTDNTAESVTNASTGSNFGFVRVDNNGVQNTVYTVARATGIIDFKVRPTVNGVNLLLPGDASISASGASGLLQISDGAGGFTSDTDLAWSTSTNTLTIGSTSVPGIIQAQNGTTVSYPIYIKGGDSIGSVVTGGGAYLTGGLGNTGGPAYLRGGSVNSGSTNGTGGLAMVVGGNGKGTGVGGDVYIVAGNGGGGAGGVAGSIILQTAGTARFTVNGAGGMTFSGPITVSGAVNGQGTSTFVNATFSGTAGFSSTVSIPYGAVGTPSLAFASDTTTGIYGATGTLSITAGGTQRAVFNSTGAAFTGTVTVPTPATTNSSTAVATTAFVKNQGYFKSDVTTVTWDPTVGLGTGNGGISYSNGNLTANFASTYGQYRYAQSLTPITVKGYFELTPNSGATSIGLMSNNGANTFAINLSNGLLSYNGTTVVQVAAYAANDVYGIAFDPTTLTATMYRNGTLIGSRVLAAGSWYAYAYDNQAVANAVTANFGASGMAFTVPTGYQSGIQPTGATFTGAVTAPTPAAGDNTTKVATTAFVTAAVESTGFKNKLLNGRFDVWQRGTTFNGVYASNNNSYYGPDRWQVFRAGGAAGATFSRIAYNGPNAVYALRMQRNAGDTGTAGLNLATSFESIDAYMLKGKTVTLSFRYLTGANFSGTAFIPVAVYGTGVDGSVASGFTGHTSVPGSTANLAPSATQQLASITFTVPTNASQLGLNFSYQPVGTAGADDWVEITNIQLEIGSVATSFEHRHVATEMALCQRYYERIYYRIDAPTSSVAFFANASLQYKVTKRVQPTTYRLAETVANITWNSTPVDTSSAIVIFSTAANAGHAIGTLVCDAEL